MPTVGDNKGVMFFEFPSSAGNLHLQHRDTALLAIVAAFPGVSADVLTRFVMPFEHWRLAFVDGCENVMRRNSTRSVRERMLKLSDAGLVTINVDCVGRAAYQCTPEGSSCALLSDRYFGSADPAHPHDLDLVQQAERVSGTTSIRTWRQGCLVQRTAFVRAEGCTPRSVIQKLRHLSKDYTVSGLFVVGRSRQDAVKVRDEGRSLGLNAVAGRARVTEQGYYHCSALDPRHVAEAVLTLLHG